MSVIIQSVDEYRSACDKVGGLPVVISVATFTENNVPIHNHEEAEEIIADLLDSWQINPTG